MMSDYDPIVHSFPDAIVVYAVGDVHLGALEHNEPAWQSFLKRVEQENAYLILVGDLLNNNVKSCKFVNVFDEVLRPREAKARMVEYLEPISKRVLCSISGNHERRTERETDQDLTYDICAKLNIEHLYRPNVAYMFICTGQRAGNKKQPECVYNFVVTHGAGGGKLTGAAVNNAEDFARTFDGLDCLVVGHTHKGFITHPQKVVLDAHNKRVSYKSYKVVSCESWVVYSGYAARGMMRPAETCKPQKLYLRADHHYKEVLSTW